VRPTRLQRRGDGVVQRRVDVAGRHAQGAAGHLADRGADILNGQEAP
jgi:hypothetical protein